MTNNYFNYIPTHEITPHTMAVIAYYTKEGTLISKILEGNKEELVHLSPSKYIDESCKFFGSSLRGRQEGTFRVAGITHKSPVSIDPSNGMYFFPTASPISPKCSWIAHTHVSKVIEINKNMSEIVFINGQKELFEVSSGSMKNQLHRTAQFRYLLDKRITYQDGQRNGNKIAEPLL